MSCNAATFLLYAALGLTFFLVSYELQVVARWSALEAGLALAPAIVLMFALSVASGSLGQRIGPRVQLTVGAVVTGAGLFLLARTAPIRPGRAMSCPAPSFSGWAW